MSSSQTLSNAINPYYFVRKKSTQCMSSVVEWKLVESACRQASTAETEFTTYLGQLDARETPLVHTTHLGLVRGRGISSST